MSKSIYCPLASHNALSNNGHSDWSGLPLVFTVENTAKLIKRGTHDYFYQYQTDYDGLSAAYYSAHHASDAINAAIDVIGRLLVHANHEDLDKGDHAAIGFLMCGLAEMQTEMTSASQSFHKAMIEGNHLSQRVNLGTVTSGGDHA